MTCRNFGLSWGCQPWSVFAGVGSLCSPTDARAGGESSSEVGRLRQEKESLPQWLGSPVLIHRAYRHAALMQLGGVFSIDKRFLEQVFVQDQQGKCQFTCDVLLPIARILRIKERSHPSSGFFLLFK